MNRIDYPNIGETLYTDELPNGLTLLVAPRKGFTKTFAMFATRYGGADRRFRYEGEWRDTPAGIAHFLEHKAFDMPDGSNTLATFSANGASPNAFTGPDMTAYHFECTDRFEDNLRLLLDFVSTPWFSEESVAKEQGIIGQEIRMLDDSPGWVLYNNLMRAMYARHPLRDSIGGTVESIAEISADMLYACHKIFYNPSNMTLAVVGDVDPERVRALALECLPETPGEVPERNYGPEEDALPAEANVSAAMEVSIPRFLMGAKLPSGETGKALMRHMLIGDLALETLLGRSSKLYLDNYAAGLLNRDFSAGVDITAGEQMVVLGGETKDPDAVCEAIFAAFEDAAKNGLDDAAFARVKKTSFGARVRSLDSFDGLCAELAQCSFLGYNPLEMFSELESITQQDAEEFIRTMLSREKMAVSVVTPTR